MAIKQIKESTNETGFSWDSSKKLHSKKKKERNKMKKMPNKEVISLFTQIASMLQSGLALMDVFDCLASEGVGTVAKNALLWKNEIAKGKTLHEALEAGNQSLPESLLSIVKSGEETGELPGFLRIYVKELKKIEDTESKMRSALTYPAIVIAIVMVLMVFMFTVAVPKLEGMFQAANAKPQGIAAVVFTIGRAASAVGTGPLLGAAIILGLWIMSKPGKKLLVNFFSFLPAMRKIKLYSEWGIFSSSVSLSLNAGLSLVDTFKLARDSAPSNLQGGTYDLLINGIVQGKSLINIKGVEFPPYIRTHIRTSERTGNLPESFAFISQYYFDEVSERIATFSQTIEPILIIMVLAVVSTVPMAIVKTMSDMYVAVMGGM